MRGTTSALRAVFGKGLGTDHEDEFVRPSNGRAFHVFDGFALVNRLLCSAGPRGSSDGHPTRTKLGNCEEHFRATKGKTTVAVKIIDMLGEEVLDTGVV